MSLLDAIPDGLDAPARRRAIARFALGMSQQEYQELHARLDGGDIDERHDGLFVAVVRRDVAAVERALGDGELRGRALSAAIRLPVSDAALRRLALNTPFATRRQVYAVLRRSARHRLAGSLLPEVPERDRPLLLAACAAGVVERWLPALPVTIDDLRRLARTAPVPVARRLAEDGGTDGRRRWSPGRAGLEAAVRRDPAAAAIVAEGQRWQDRGTPVGYRARAAARALRAALDTGTETAAVELLAGTLRSAKVASAKESARALGALRTPAAAGALLDAWHRPDLHRDVRATIATALVTSAADAGRAVADVLTAAVRPGAEPDAVREAILATPVKRIPVDRRPAVARLLAAALDTPDPAILAAYGRWSRYAPEGLDAVARLVGVDQPDEVFEAARATLGAALGTPAGDLAWSAAVDLLAAQAARERLRVMTAAVQRDAWSVLPAAFRAAAHTLERALAPLDLPGVRATLLARLAFADLLDPPAGDPDLALWDRLLAATADRPHRIDPGTWRALHDHADPARFPAVLTHLERHTGLTATLLWLRLATIQGTWTEPQLHRLDTLRHHPDPDIREAAHDVRPARSD
ncbi:hypothetical protein ACQEVZ_41100 [Dactylosporangium sp. CA-152071]|uniref:hypothetical protein n=1 Tax=Dactylosporangium sp. CA-152071 TaxID=3239933 RepID=UPI003D9491A3